MGRRIGSACSNVAELQGWTTLIHKFLYLIIKEQYEREIQDLRNSSALINQPHGCSFMAASRVLHLLLKWITELRIPDAQETKV